jgi:hypothetical protein
MKYMYQSLTIAWLNAHNDIATHLYVEFNTSTKCPICGCEGKPRCHLDCNYICTQENHGCWEPGNSIMIYNSEEETHE